jgi:hypothetical protein
MKQLFLIILLLPISLNANEVTLEIEKKAAALSACSSENPCEVSVIRDGDFYVAKVKRSTIITNYGVIKYKTGSITYHVFDNKGKYINSNNTT